MLFDAGGTLIHLDGDRICRAAGAPHAATRFREAASAAAAALGAWIVRHPASTDAERVPFFLDEILRGLGLEGESARKAAAAAVSAEHARSNLWSRAGEGAAETLSALRNRGYRIGVVSNADGRVRALLETAGLSAFLEFVVDSFEVGFEKPDPRIFLAATERLQVAASECVYVGDIFSIDVVGARAAGMRAILFGTGAAEEPVERVLTLPALLAKFPGVERA
ncbi:MAG: HAD-IA family hydrolase [Acidobacteria bacterium]|nr:HAD-IA family hydrolase [Acidobacteriota bacterium]MCA1610957.1 HAD-IA family hydrolase [Acidobacteriota bacterium]